jgi:ABC-2 type transport system permease protein
MTQPMTPTRDVAAPPRLRLLLRLKLTLLHNRIEQSLNHSPLRLLLIVLFVAAIWGALYAIFNEAFVFMRRFEQSAIAIPYVFHVFFVAMTFLLAFSTAVLAYGALFSRAEPSFLLATPHTSRNIVTILYLESLFFSSWSLLLLGIPLMLAIGQVLDLSWHFYVTFIIAFLGFVPIPGAFGLLAALAVALWLPRLAKRTLFCAGGAALLLAVVWWGRLWAVSASSSNDALHGFLAEFEYLKGALLPSTWVSNAIQKTVEGRPGDAAFYLAVTLSTALFCSWIAVNVAGRKLLVAYGRAHAAHHRAKARSGWAARWLTGTAFFYLPQKMRLLILKDVRNFLRDPAQWSQLAILFGLMGLYLIYLPRARPGGFNVSWRAMICFLNYGAITLILSTFTSRFVFPMISLEGKQMWLVGLWPLPRASVMWAKFCYALTVTATAAISVTVLAVVALELPFPLALVQVLGTLATCVGLCGMAVGLGARMPSYREANSGRIAAGFGGTVNLFASVALVSASVGLFGGICYHATGKARLDHIGPVGAALFLAIVLLTVGAAALSMHLGIRSFRRQQF